MWGFVLAEQVGLALLLVPSTKKKMAHSIVIAAENVAERVFEDVKLSKFPVEAEDMAGIGSKLIGLGDGMAENAFDEWLKSEGLL